MLSSATDEQVGKVIQGAIGASQAEKRFKALEQSADEAINRLIPEHELPLAHRGTQFALPLAIGGDGDFEMLVKDFVAVAAGLLGAIHGKVGVADKKIGRGVFGIGHGGADAGAGADFLAKDLERPLKLMQDAAGDHFKIVCGNNILDQNGKLVATQSRGRVLGTQRSSQATGDRQSAERRPRRGPGRH